MKRRDVDQPGWAPRLHRMACRRRRAARPQSEGRISLSRPVDGAGTSRLQAFHEGLQGAGLGRWPGRDRSTLRRGPLRRGMPALAQELVAAKVDVLVPIGFNVAVEAARAATKTIPIVCFDLETDPVASGIAATLARPGGNMTGVYFDFRGLQHEVDGAAEGDDAATAPKSSVLRDPANPSPQLKGSSRPSPVRLAVDGRKSIGRRQPGGIRCGISRGRPSSIRMRVVDPVVAAVRHQPRIGWREQTIKNRLPAITLFPEFVARRRPDGLWRRSAQRVPSGRRHGRQGAERREACRIADRAADQFRAGRQSQRPRRASASNCRLDPAAAPTK